MFSRQCYDKKAKLLSKFFEHDEKVLLTDTSHMKLT